MESAQTPVRGSQALHVDPGYIKHLCSLPPIPKKIHMMWPDKNVIYRHDLRMVRHSLLALKTLNPEWNVTVYEYADIDHYLSRTPLLSAADRKMLEGAHIIERTDAFRLLVMYEEGGYGFTTRTSTRCTRSRCTLSSGRGRACCCRPTSTSTSRRT
jgi:hypothetical protein